MSIIKKTLEVGADAVDVWAAIAEPTRMQEWAPPIDRSVMSGEHARTCSLAGGGEVVEQILLNDARQMRFEYTITEAPMPLTSHHSTIVVEALGNRARVTWETNVEPQATAEAFEPLVQAAIDGLKTYVEGR